MKKIILLVPTIICVLISCSDNTTNPSETKEIWPLKVGNYWVWKFTSYDSIGNIESEYVDTVIVYKDSLWGADRIYALKSFSNNIHFVYDFAVNRKDGFYGFRYRNNKIDSFLIIKYPGKEGDIFVGYRDTVAISSVNLQYQSIAGKFICYKYSSFGKLDEFSKDLLKFDMYFSPGIGLILNEGFKIRKGGNYFLFNKTELMSYFVQ